MSLHKILIILSGEGFLIVSLTFGKRKWELCFKGISSNRYQVALDLPEISKVVEHEIVLLESYLDDLVDSIRVAGFLDPILVTPSNGGYVVADGTHRLYALKQIKIQDKIDLLHIPVAVLHENWFVRKAWAMVFEEGVRNLSVIEKEWNLIPTNIESEENIWASFDRGTVSAIVRSGSKSFLVEESSRSRELFLKNVKRIDSIIGMPDRYLIASEALKSGFDWVMLAPPVDRLGDMRILVKNAKLRRRKGSRTIVPIRLMYLPLSVGLLRLPKERAIKKITMKIDECIETNKVTLALPGFETFAVCRQSWDHYILIMNKDTVSEVTPRNILRTLGKKMIPLETVLT